MPLNWEVIVLFFCRLPPVLPADAGEILEPVSLDLSGYSFLLIHPEIKIETAWAFSKIKPAKPRL